MSETVYIGLGSNLGDREHHLVRAVEALASIDAVAVVDRSALYESAPVGPGGQPRYLNAAVKLECGLAPQRLLAIVKQIEADLGRVWAPRWGPRVIDLDLLLWEGRVVADANLQIPHVALHGRRFALEPLHDLDPTALHPMLGVTIRELLQKVAPQDVVRFEGTRWSRGDAYRSTG